MTKVKQGFIPDEVFKVVKAGNKYRTIDIDGETVNIKTLKGSNVPRETFNQGKALQAYIQDNGIKIYRPVSMDVFNSMVSTLNTNKGETVSEKLSDHEAITNYIHKESLSLKPKNLIMTDLKWKYLIRSAVRAKNIMMTGPTGCGKTLAARTLVKVLERPDFYFNLGSTQDPRATLIGNTQFNSDKGTFFAESAFITAIRTPFAVILLDEMTRAHPDAWNILMTVLDDGQRYLRLDEKEGSPIVEVAEGVTFISTANIGTEYTSTRVLDRAIRDRFVTIEMDVLTYEEEFGLLKQIYPDVNEYYLNAVAETAHTTRLQSSSDEGELTSMISTRASIEMGGLLYDGFTLLEAAEIAILPFFLDDGVDSERTFVRQILQKFADDEKKHGLFGDQADVDNNGEVIPKF